MNADQIDKLEQWAWMLHDLADNMERAVTYEASGAILYRKVCEWSDCLGDVLFDVKDQMKVLP